jgi:hypothetical protein
MNIQISVHWWNFLLPSSWFAAPFSIFFLKERGLYYILLAVTAVAVPVAALILYVKAAAPAFEKNLQKLTSGGGARVRAGSGAFRRLISGLVCFKSDERVFFNFTCNVLKSERKLKLRLFPNLTLGIIMPFVMMLSLGGRSKSITESLNVITHGKYYLFMYMSLIFFSTLFSLISMSESFRGAWIYRAAPVADPGSVLKGALKAFLYKYVMPFYLITCLIFTVLYGVRILPDLLLIFVNLMVLTLILFKFSKKELPFYKDFQTTQGASNIGLVFLSFALCGGLAAAHYFLGKTYTWGFSLNLGISLVLFVLLWVFSFRIGWKDIVRDAE